METDRGEIINFLYNENNVFKIHNRFTNENKKSENKFLETILLGIPKKHKPLYVLKKKKKIKSRKSFVIGLNLAKKFPGSFCIQLSGSGMYNI